MKIKALLASNGIVVHIVGSVWMDGEGKKDIDFILCSVKSSESLRRKMRGILQPKYTSTTDWKGWFFYGTKWGDLDFFFEDNPYEK